MKLWIGIGLIMLGFLPVLYCILGMVIRLVRLVCPISDLILFAIGILIMFIGTILVGNDNE